ncbi:MAG: hypothetical protein NXI13_17615 [Proteobacteria bacterium]|nr:hypothetical protein [Pseudomonadota bacterium]
MMSVVIALIFAFNIFAVVPMAANHANEEGVAHYMVAAAEDLTNTVDKKRHGHIEKCGVASCSISSPEFQTGAIAKSGTKTSFSALSTQLGSVSLFPPERPPKA